MEDVKVVAYPDVEEAIKLISLRTLLNRKNVRSARQVLAQITDRKVLVRACVHLFVYTHDAQDLGKVWLAVQAVPAEDRDQARLEVCLLLLNGGLMRAALQAAVHLEDAYLKDLCVLLVADLADEAELQEQARTMWGKLQRKKSQKFTTGISLFLRTSNATYLRDEERFAFGQEPLLAYTLTLLMVGRLLKGNKEDDARHMVRRMPQALFRAQFCLHMYERAKAQNATQVAEEDLRTAREAVASLGLPQSITALGSVYEVTRLERDLYSLQRIAEAFPQGHALRCLALAQVEECLSVQDAQKPP